jgi:membrane fusion protein (multidrug efflux system)
MTAPRQDDAQPLGEALPPVPASDAASTSRRRRLRWGLIGLGPLLVLAVGAWFYVTGGRYVSTDDAFVKTDLASISAQVPGQVATVSVKNNQRVEAGQVLFTLDAASYRAALDEAEANLARAREQIAVLRANYRERQTMLKSAEEASAFRQREYERQQKLRSSGAVSEKQLDQVRHDYEQAQRSADAVRQQMAAILAQLGGDVGTPTEDLAQYRAALAKRDDAQIAFDRTQVKAPAAGVVANVTVRPGDYIAAGQPVFSLAEIDTVWVEANFKETQLTKVADGQSATVTVDAYPDVVWNATVESVSPASGNEFSVLPAENSSGNWVKVVQRIPVRLALVPQANAPQLRAGMSVTVEIDTAHREETPAHAAADRAPGTRG